MSKNPLSIKVPFDIILHVVGSILFLSGAFAAAVDITDALDWDNQSIYPYRSLALKIHGAAAMGFLISLGALIPTHIYPAWKAARNRISGGLLLSIFSILIFTGYGLYYFGGELSRQTVLWIHLSLGLLDPPLLALHVFLGKRSRNR